MAVNGPAADVMELLRIILLLMFAVANVVALLMALNAPVPALVPDIMLFSVIVKVPLPAVKAVIPVNMEAPVPPAVQPVMVFPVMVTSVPALLVMPVKELTKAAVPLTKFDMVLPVMLMASVAPELMAIMGAAAAVPVVILLMILSVILLLPVVMVITVRAAEPPVQLLKVLVLKVLFKLVLLLIQPEMAVAPVTVTFEKLFPFCVITEPGCEATPVPLQKVTVPPIPVFEKAVTI